MKTILLTILTAGLLAIAVSNGSAQSFKVKTFRMTVNGSSSLHDWQSTVEKAECKGSFIIEKSALTLLKDVVVKIAVTSIKSTKGKMMDNKTYEAFRHEKNPAIIFTLTGQKVNEANGMIAVKGNLLMAGVVNVIDLTLTYKILSNGDLQVTGTKKLAMSDYNMEPPTAMMGTITVADEVEVAFDLILTQNNTI